MKAILINQNKENYGSGLFIKIQFALNYFVFGEEKKRYRDLDQYKFHEPL